MNVDQQKTRNLICIAAGVAGLLISRHYSGPGAILLHSHGANVTFSFGAYFILKLWQIPLLERRPALAVYTFLGVSAQEVTQALSLYPGTYDVLDFPANAAGIAAAWVIDTWTTPSATGAPDGDH